MIIQPKTKLTSLFLCCLTALAFDSNGNSKPSTADLDCDPAKYRHKTAAELSSMTVAERLDEMVAEQTFHFAADWNDRSHDKEYDSVLNRFINERPLDLLPTLAQWIDAYDPALRPACYDRAGVRFFVASATASDIDNNNRRLRANDEGRKVMASMERGIERMRKAGFDGPNHKMHGRYSLASHHLLMARSDNIRDEIIAYTLKMRHKIEMTPKERIAFSNFLTELDPAYPSWSEPDSQFPGTHMKDSTKYYSAYQSFKAKR